MCEMGVLLWAVLNLIFGYIYYQISSYYPRESPPWYLFAGSGLLLLILGLLAIAILFGFFVVKTLVQIVVFL
jgi:hypothetical protein